MRLLEESTAEDEIYGWETHAFTQNEEVVIAEYLLLFITMLCAVLVLQFYVGKVWQLEFLSESGSTVLLGMIFGGLFRLGGKDTSDNSRNESLLGFSSTIFFVGFLPPILFNSGYQINRRLFFKNMGGILILAVFGTAFATALIGFALWGVGELGVCFKLSAIECITFGSVISATDPVSTLAVFSELKVHPTLFYLVFGESILNDAIAITLFKTTSKYIGTEITSFDCLVAFVDFLISCVGSIAIGYLLGLLFAWIYKTIDFSKHNLLVVTLYVAMVYVPFLLSETLQLSGILTILFTAIAARRYISYNISAHAQESASFVFEMMAYLSETGVFLYLGIDVFSKHVTAGYNYSLVLWSILFCLVVRAIHVYPSLWFVNNYRARIAQEKGHDANLISNASIHMVWWSGLRGVVAYSSANIFPDTLGHRNVIVATTTSIVLYTMFVHGGLTKWMCSYLGIEVGVNVEKVVSELPKVTTSSFVNWEHEYIYPLVIRGYTDPDYTKGDTQEIIEEDARSEHGLDDEVKDMFKPVISSGYNKFAGLGADEIISVPHLRSSASIINVKNFRIDSSGRISAAVGDNKL